MKDEVVNYRDESADHFSAVMTADKIIEADDYSVSYTSVIQWAETRSNHYKRKALDDFASYGYAGAWLVAVALDLDYTVLTDERSDPGTKKRVKIPDACMGCGVKYASFLQFLEVTGYRG